MAAVIAAHHGGIWPRRPDQPTHTHMPTGVNVSGLMPAYDAPSRTVTHPPTSRAFQATTSHMDLTMPLFQTHTMTTSVPYQPGAFAFDSLAVNPYNMQQAFTVSTYPPAFPQAPYAGTGELQQHGLPTVREARNGLAIERTPVVKLETSSPVQPSQIFPDGAFGEDYKQAQGHDSRETQTGINFSTDVDTLMRAIQAKSQTPQRPQQEVPPKVQDCHQPPPSAAVGAHKKVKDGEPKGSSKPKKRYHCSMPDCHKSFYQKTHLEIHTRAHTGVKPFLCKEPSCGQRFSQLGNLKTHERRHTGERPYSCEMCGKTFAQRGNVRAHKIVHQQIKPFTCKLDDCGKQFTQLGNLKSHQNKFHAATLRFLTQKFASIREGDPVTVQDKELWEYFASLYKNSNKGIKGRGKDRRISAATSVAASNASSYASHLTTSSGRNYPSVFQQHSGSDRSSRSSSLSSDETQKASEGYDFNAPMDTGFHPQPHGYSDMVFPERKLY